MYRTERCGKCDKEMKCRTFALPGGFMTECLGCGDQQIHPTTRSDLEPILEEMYAGAFLQITQMLKDEMKDSIPFVSLVTGKLVNLSAIPKEDIQNIVSIIEYVSRTARQQGLMEKARNHSLLAYGFGPLSFAEYKLIYFLFVEVYRRKFNGEAVPEKIVNCVKSLSYILAPKDDGQYVVTPPFKSTGIGLPEDVESYFDEISKAFTRSVMEKSELQLVEQYSLHCMLPVMAGVINTCREIFRIFSSPHYMNYVLATCEGCVWIRRLQSQFRVEEGLLSKEKWTNAEGQKAINKPRCSESFSTMPCLPRLMMKYRHEISILRRKLRKIEKAHSETELAIEYPDYTKNLIFYVVLALFLELCGLYSLKIRYDKNYEMFINTKLHEYKESLLQQRHILEEKGINRNSMLFGNVNVVISAVTNTINYLEERNFSLASSCVQRLGAQVTPDFSGFFSEFAKSLEVILDVLKDDTADNSKYLLPEIGKEYMLTPEEGAKVLAFFYNDRDRSKINISQRIKFLRSVWLEPLFSRKDLKSKFPSSTLTVILREFRNLKIIQKTSKYYKVRKEVFQLVFTMRKLD